MLEERSNESEGERAFVNGEKEAVNGARVSI